MTTAERLHREVFELGHWKRIRDCQEGIVYGLKKEDTNKKTK